MPTARHAESGAGFGALSIPEPDDPPFVGREAERERLLGLWEESRREGGPAFVCLRGVSGTGKSRLARWFVRTVARRSGAEALWAAHSPLPGPKVGLPAMFARFFGVDGDDESGRAVEETFERRGWFQGEERRLFGRWVADFLESRLPTATGGSTRAGRTEERRVLVRLVQRLAAETPVVIWLDDVQWGRRALDFAGSLCAQCELEDSPLMVVATARDDELGDRPVEQVQLSQILEREDATSMTVEPLPRSAETRLIQSIIPLSESLVERVVDRTGGHPLFTLQLLSDWVDRDLLELSTSGFVLAESADRQLPDDIYALWQSRIERFIGEFDRSMRAEVSISLEIAAILGTTVSYGDWRGACQRRGVGLPDLLPRALFGSSLGRETEGGWEFVHGMLRESLVRRAREEGRYADHHRACAAMLEARYALEEGSILRRRAHHLVEADELEAALDPLVRAASRHMKRGDIDRCRKLLDAHTAACDRLALPSDDSRRLEVLVHRGWLARFDGDIRQAGEYLETVAERVGRETALEVRGEFERLRASILFARGAIDESLAAGERSVEAFEAAEDRRGVTRTLQRLGHTLRHVGKLGEAERAYRRSLENGRRLGHAYLAGHASVGLASILRRRRRFDEAQRRVERAREYFEEVGELSGRAECENALGEIARRRGDLEAALEHYERALDIRATFGFENDLLDRLNQGLVLVQMSRFAEAAPILMEVGERFEARDHSRGLVYVVAGLVACAAGLQRWGWAEALLEMSVERVGALEIRSTDLAESFELAGELASTGHRPALARASWRLSLEQWRGLGAEPRVDAIGDALEALST